MKKYKLNKKIAISTLVIILFLIIFIYFNNKPQVTGEKFSVSQETTLTLGTVLGNMSDSISKSVNEIEGKVQNKLGMRSKKSRKKH